MVVRALTLRFILPADQDWSKILICLLAEPKPCTETFLGRLSKAFLYNPETQNTMETMSGRPGGILRRFWSSEILKAAKEEFGEPKTLLVHHVAAYFDGGGVTTSIPRPVV